MTEEQNKDLYAYMNTIGIEGKEDSINNSFDYRIEQNTLVTGLDLRGNREYFALDDKTGKIFNSLGDIVEFYKLPVLPDNVRTKEELKTFKKDIGL